MQKARHREVGKELRLRNVLLPFTLTWRMLLVSKYTLPFSCWHHLGHFSLNKAGALCLESFTSWDIDNITEFFFRNSSIIVHLSLVSNVLEAEKVEMQVEIARDYWNFLEYFQSLNRQSVKHLINHDHNAFKASCGSRKVTLIRCDFSRLGSSFCCWLCRCFGWSFSFWIIFRFSSCF